MIQTAHEADPSIIIAYNDGDPPPSNADLYIHHSLRVPGKPWLDTEATPKNAPGGYWKTFSKETHMETNGHFYNYSRIGLYTEEMKANQFAQTIEGIEKYNGHKAANLRTVILPDSLK